MYAYIFNDSLSSKNQLTCHPTVASGQTLSCSTPTNTSRQIVLHTVTVPADTSHMFIKTTHQGQFRSSASSSNQPLAFLGYMTSLHGIKCHSRTNIIFVLTWEGTPVCSGFQLEEECKEQFGMSGLLQSWVIGSLSEAMFCIVGCSQLLQQFWEMQKHGFALKDIRNVILLYIRMEVKWSKFSVWDKLVF